MNSLKATGRMDRMGEKKELLLSDVILSILSKKSLFILAILSP